MSISVVVVNYNNSRYLRKALDSVVTQSMQPAEVIVADDCSTDGSCSIVAEFVRSHPSVRLIRNVKNLGPAGNRDVGIRACTSDNFVTLDSDDWFESGALEAIDKRLRADEERKIVISNFRVVRDEVTPLFIIDTSSYCALSQEEQLFALAARKRFIPGNQLAMATELYTLLGGLDVSLRLYEDWDFMLRATIAGVRWAHSGVVGYSYRKSGLGVSSTSRIWTHLRDMSRVAAGTCRVSRCDRFIIAGFVDLVLRKGVMRLVTPRSPEGFN